MIQISYDSKMLVQHEFRIQFPKAIIAQIGQSERRLIQDTEKTDKTWCTTIQVFYTK